MSATVTDDGTTIAYSAWGRRDGSPVLLIQGDDDRNVQFQQTVDLAVRLHAHHVPYEELVLPNEIHGFLRWSSWAKADEATAAFLGKELQSEAASNAARN